MLVSFSVTSHTTEEVEVEVSVQFRVVKAKDTETAPGLDRRRFCTVPVVEGQDWLSVESLPTELMSRGQKNRLPFLETGSKIRFVLGSDDYVVVRVVFQWGKAPLPMTWDRKVNLCTKFLCQ